MEPCLWLTFVAYTGMGAHNLEKLVAYIGMGAHNLEKLGKPPPTTP